MGTCWATYKFKKKVRRGRHLKNQMEEEEGVVSGREIRKSGNSRGAKRVN